jgi:hypothetical protein
MVLVALLELEGARRGGGTAGVNTAVPSSLQRSPLPRFTSASPRSLVPQRGKQEKSALFFADPVVASQLETIGLSPVCKHPLPSLHARATTL